MGKWLIWIMCLVGYGHTLASTGMPIWLYTLFLVAALVAYILWCEEK